MSKDVTYLHDATDTVASSLTHEVSRRSFLKVCAGSIGAMALAPELARAAILRERALVFRNTHTGESIRQVYWTPQDGYVRESVIDISWALRDHRNDQVKLFDPSVLDQLFALQLQLQTGLNRPFNILSGYRSAATNRMLCERSRGVARNSYHTQAMALDIRVPGREIFDVYQAACSLGAGGVGYYPSARFVHIDSGPVRYWS